MKGPIFLTIIDAISVAPTPINHHLKHSQQQTSAAPAKKSSPQKPTNYRSNVNNIHKTLEEAFLNVKKHHGGWIFKQSAHCHYTRTHAHTHIFTQTHLRTLNPLWLEAAPSSLQALLSYQGLVCSPPWVCPCRGHSYTHRSNWLLNYCSDRGCVWPAESFCPASASAGPVRARLRGAPSMGLSSRTSGDNITRHRVNTQFFRGDCWCVWPWLTRKNLSAGLKWQLHC